MVLLSTSGKAHDLLLNWSEQGNDLKTIFFNLSLQFDRRMTADEARQKLLTLSVPKNSDEKDKFTPFLSLCLYGTV